MKFSLDSKSLFVGVDLEVEQIDLHNHTSITKRNAGKEGYFVCGMSLSKKDQLLATNVYEGDIIVWDLKTMKNIFKIPRTKACVIKVLVAGLI